MVCDYNLLFLNINANFGGSTHDSYIFNNSALKEHLQSIYNANNRLWLVGDSGYAQLPYLMTPIRNPSNRREELYNEAHIRSRNSIERAYGLLKMRFGCLLRERTLRYALQKTAKFLKVCAALQNLCIKGRVEMDEVENWENIGGDQEEMDVHGYHALSWST